MWLRVDELPARPRSLESFANMRCKADEANFCSIASIFAEFVEELKRMLVCQECKVNAMTHLVKLDVGSDV